MTYDQWHERFFTALHAVVGICGHCGKRKCAGRKEHSVLPKILSLDDVVAAGIRARHKEKT